MIATRVHSSPSLTESEAMRSGGRLLTATMQQTFSHRGELGHRTRRYRMQLMMLTRAWLFAVADLLVQLPCLVMSSYAGGGMAEELVDKLASFRPLDAAQTNFLRGIFLSLSDRPSDQTAVSAFVRAHYRDIPSAARGALGQGVLELFASEERNAEMIAQRKAAAIAAGQSAAEAAAAAAAAVQSERPPRITWRSFHRVCAALGLHLNERRGQAAIRKFASEDSSAASASTAAAASSASGSSAAATSDPGMSFDDFLIFYAQLSKCLSIDQELREVWKMLDADLSGIVPLRVLSQVMTGLEQVAPTNDASRSKFFYDSCYGFGWSPEEKRMSAAMLVDAQLSAFFHPRGKSVELDSTIQFSEFVEFMYA